MKGEKKILALKDACAEVRAAPTDNYTAKKKAKKSE